MLAKRYLREQPSGIRTDGQTRRSQPVADNKPVQDGRPAEHWPNVRADRAQTHAGFDQGGTGEARRYRERLV